MKCRICNNTENNRTYIAREMMMGLREKFTYYQCHKCKCLQIAEPPGNISNYYSDEYYSFEENEDAGWVTRFLKYKRNQFAVFNRSVIGKLLYEKYPKEDLRSLSNINLKRSDKILDVGCGKGALLRALHQLGFKNLTGIDPFNREEVIDISGNFKIFRKSIRDVKGRWDLIMMHHVFEHMADPAGVLENVIRLLSSGGYCIIRIPVTQSEAWENYRENWVQLDPPRHFFIHSPQSIKCLLRDKNLELKDIIYDSTSFQFWGSIQYENDIPLQHETSYAVNPDKSMFTPEEIRKFSQKAEDLNREHKGDQAVFILRKD